MWRTKYVMRYSRSSSVIIAPTEEILPPPTAFNRGLNAPMVLAFARHQFEMFVAASEATNLGPHVRYESPALTALGYTIGHVSYSRFMLLAREHGEGLRHFAAHIPRLFNSCIRSLKPNCIAR